jgi:hypothetical protein
MLTYLIASLILLIFVFGFVVFFGAPYLPTLTKQMEASFELLDLKPDQTLLELGCGDGKVLIAAAQRGINSVGIELNPILAAIAWLRTRRYTRRTAKNSSPVTIRIICGNFFTKKWPPADGIFVFLLDEFMVKLDKKVMQYIDVMAKSENARPKFRLVSFVFRIPGREPKMEKDGVLLYEY